jgi:hypothetical protein
MVSIFDIPATINSPNLIGRKAYYLGFLARNSKDLGYKTPVAYIIPAARFETKVNCPTLDAYSTLPFPNEIPKGVIYNQQNIVAGFYEELAKEIKDITGQNQYYIRSSTVGERISTLSYAGVNNGGFWNIEDGVNAGVTKISEVISATHRAYSTLYYDLVEEPIGNRECSLLITQIVDRPCIWGTAYVTANSVFFKGTFLDDRITYVKSDEVFVIENPSSVKDTGRFKKAIIAEFWNLSQELLKSFNQFLDAEALPIEIEFCIDRNEKINILQIRPVSGFSRFPGQLPVNTTIGKYSFKKLIDATRLPRDETLLIDRISGDEGIGIAVAIQNTDTIDLFTLLWIINKKQTKTPINILGILKSAQPHIHLTSAILEFEKINSYSMVTDDFSLDCGHDKEFVVESDGINSKAYYHG